MEFRTTNCLRPAPAGRTRKCVWFVALDDADEMDVELVVIHCRVETVGSSWSECVPSCRIFYARHTRHRREEKLGRSAGTGANNIGVMR